MSSFSPSSLIIQSLSEKVFYGVNQMINNKTASLNLDYNKAWNVLQGTTKYTLEHIARTVNTHIATKSYAQKRRNTTRN